MDATIRKAITILENMMAYIEGLPHSDEAMEDRECIRVMIDSLKAMIGKEYLER